MSFTTLDSIVKIMQLIISATTIITLIYTFTNFVKSPRESMERRVKELEDWVDKIEDRLKQGTNHFEALDESTAVTQQALLAIMDGLLSDNNKDELKKARNDLYDYLTKNRN